MAFSLQGALTARQGQAMTAVVFLLSRFPKMAHHPLSLQWRRCLQSTSEPKICNRGIHPVPCVGTRHTPESCRFGHWAPITACSMRFFHTLKNDTCGFRINPYKMWGTKQFPKAALHRRKMHFWRIFLYLSRFSECKSGTWFSWKADLQLSVP